MWSWSILLLRYNWIWFAIILLRVLHTFLAIRDIGYWFLMFSFLSFFFETGSHYIAQVGLELSILLSQTTK
jgi:hypothetical protein